uniref:ZP domain-containing protein n=1 Tax=Lepeophtheirus salmonis TaxID=72036 RepID=A0A0K2VFK8_LEPSM
MIIQFLRRVPSMYHLLAPVIIFISLFSRHAKSEDIFFKQLYGSCSTNSYMLTIYTSKPFSGRLFSKNFKECLSLGNGTRNLILSVGLSCGAEFEKGLKFSDQIYVQKDPYLQQVDDEVVEIRCEPLKNGTASLIRYGENVDPIFYQNLRTRFAVNESKDSLETDKGHVRTAEWHNEVDNEVDEGVYVQAWMDLLPLLSGYQHFFFIGQNVSLIIKWKNPKSKHQPKVGSCFASSGKKESLRLTNPAGQSVQNIFPSNFTYYTSKSGITTATASFLMFKFANSNELILKCRLIFASKVPIILEARAENIDDDQGSEAKFNSLNQEIPSHYLRSDDLSAQESTQELLEIERDFEEPLVCMSRLKMVLAFGVLILVLFIALVFSCMLWSRAKSFTSQLNSNTKFPGGLIPRPFKRIPGPYVVSSLPYR